MCIEMKYKIITIEDKRKWLKLNGWYQYNSDRWLLKNKCYQNPDWSAMSTEEAYKYAINDLKY